MLESWKNHYPHWNIFVLSDETRSDGIRAAGLHCGPIVKRVTSLSTNGQSACARWQRTAWAEIGQKVLTPAQQRLYLYVNRIICCECGSVTTFKLNHDTHSFSVYMCTASVRWGDGAQSDHSLFSNLSWRAGSRSWPFFTHSLARVFGN